MQIEHDIESYLTSKVRGLGGLCIKFIPDHMRGMPDRIVLLPKGKLIWVELKRPDGGKVASAQKYRHVKLTKLGQTVYICSTKAEVDAMLARYI